MTTTTKQNGHVRSEQSVSSEVLNSLVLNGDISKMNETQRMEYYTQLCQSLGLNPLTQPFQIIRFEGKEKLYTTRDCTEQLRKLHGVSITDIVATDLKGIYVVTAKAIDKTGKTDASTGAVSVKGMWGDALANAIMKAETKAKRRVTLSICGLGMLDETELETIPGATPPAGGASIIIQSNNPQVEHAIENLQHCDSVDELTILKESLEESILRNSRFIEAGRRRYAELMNAVAA